MSKLWKNFSTR